MAKSCFLAILDHLECILSAMKTTRSFPTYQKSSVVSKFQLLRCTNSNLFNYLVIPFVCINPVVESTRVRYPGIQRSQASDELNYLALTFASKCDLCLLV